MREVGTGDDQRIRVDQARQNPARFGNRVVRALSRHDQDELEIVQLVLEQRDLDLDAVLLLIGRGHVLKEWVLQQLLGELNVEAALGPAASHSASPAAR